MKSGSARVFEHQVPGGQYSNLLVQCRSMGLYDKWEEVLDAYRDVNKLFGDIVKVTPSSKCVGDLALYLVTRSLTTSDLLDPSKVGIHPYSTVKDIFHRHELIIKSFSPSLSSFLHTGGIHRLPRERGRTTAWGLGLPSSRVSSARGGCHTQGRCKTDGIIPIIPISLFALIIQ